MTSQNNKVFWTGNIGEWGEVFALLHLLAHPLLYNADMHGKKIEDEFSEIRSLYRTEVSGVQISLDIVEDMVIANIGQMNAYCCKRELFVEKAHELFVGMTTQGRTEAYPHIQEFLEKLGCESLNAPAHVKADLSAKVYEGYLSSVHRKDYSIKTVVGGKPSLANASAQSYIDYELTNFDEKKRDAVMSINTKSKVVERTRLILELCSEPPKPVVRSDTFRRNLNMCYFTAPEVVGFALLYGQLIKGKHVIDSIAELVRVNPAGFTEETMLDYEVSIRRYLWGVVFDLDPGTLWEGVSQVDGYLLVTNDEEVLTYQVSKQRDFENYLLLHTCWDTPSTTRHPDTGTVWQREDGQWMYTLNCVVRFNEKEYRGPNLGCIGVEKQ